jgi:methylenetetrahydrofolate reductase (NADPH)
MTTTTAASLIARLLADHSLEIGAADGKKLDTAAALLPKSTSVAIAHFPNEDMTARVQAAVAVRRSGHVPIPHIAARRVASTVELTRFLDDLRQSDAEVDRLFVIAGDPDEPLGPYRDALALIETGGFESYDISSIGIAGYPDGHPRIATPELWSSLQKKVDAIVARQCEVEIVTQFSFDADAVLSWLGELRDRGISAPVKVGVPGPISLSGLLHFAARSGVSASKSALAKYGTSIRKVIGTVGPLAFLEHLADGLEKRDYGHIALHFFTFGALEKTVDWVRATSSSRE